MMQYGGYVYQVVFLSFDEIQFILPDLEARGSHNTFLIIFQKIARGRSERNEMLRLAPSVRPD